MYQAYLEDPEKTAWLDLESAGPRGLKIEHVRVGH